ncbi:peptidoglycan DD-metalloendopeptidase family protein [uncultured Flavobacterium sp.]|uniref:murein hydrolase activator EnvC family protein n=1 Tax=uncultured Flavobacterium sp. TaxID=165435 RepID=UPI0030ED41EF
MKSKIVIIAFLLCSTLNWAQISKQQELEARKEKIINAILQYNGLLKIEKKKETSVLTEIKEKNARIKLSQNLINTNETQVKYISNDIAKNQNIIKSLTKELEILKSDYASMIVKAYKSRSQSSRVMFVLSSQNFYQAYKRIQYMKQYAGFRKSQAEEIKIKQQRLNEAIVALQSKKEQKEKVIVQTAKEKEELERQKQEKEKLVKIIQKDKKKYSAEIDKKEKEKRDIDKQIKKTIADAIVAANKRAAEKAKAEAKKNNTSTKTTSTVKTTPAASSVTSSKFILNAEGKVDSDNFKANRGKLPLPVEKGYISLPYGDQPHPIHKNLTTHNSGVEITTQAGSYARAVFGGEVIQIQSIYANNYAVYIRHGDFITLYMNIESLNVSVGDNVSIKQRLGKIHTNSDGKTTMKFIVTQNTTTLNPSSWLSL